MRNRIRVLLLVLAALSMIPALTQAQGVASITGVVTDSSGALVPGASVKVVDTRTGTAYFGKTSGDGSYRIVDLPPGQGYAITVKKDGFQTLIINNLYLPVATTTTRDIKLELGSITQTVQVTAEASVTLNTTDASIGNVIDSKQVADLPSLFRDDASVLLQLQPGVQISGGDSQNGSVTGSRADAGNITLDGLDVNDETIGTPFAAVGRAPIDSVSEVRTIVGNPDATFGRSSGAQVALVTKSGSNEWHGAVNEYNRVSAMAANGFFSNLTGTPRGQLTRNQFGGYLGGPIVKNKLFFFFNYSGRRDARSELEDITVPLDSFLNGEIVYTNNLGAKITLPATGGAPGSCASVQSCDPLGVGANANLLAFLSSRYPASKTSLGGDGFNTGGFIFNSPLHVHENTFVGRLDYQLSSKHTLFARGTWDRDNDTQTPRLFPQDPGDQGSFVGHERSWVVGDTWVISPTMTNQANFGLTRQVDDFPINFAPTAPTNFGLDILSNPYGDIRQQGRNVPVPELRDTFSWSVGKHSLQFGMDYRWTRVHSSNTNDINFQEIGLQSFITSLDDSERPADISQDPSALNAWDQAFTTILGRYASTTSQYNYDVAGNPFAQFSPSLRNFHYNEAEIFFEDTWKIRSDLTLTYGLRWNYDGVPYEVNGFQAVPTAFVNDILPIRVSEGNMGINGDSALPFISYTLGGPKNHGPNYYHDYHKSFGPRLGIAYSPSFTDGWRGKLFGDRKTSIRAGGGIVYDRLLSTLQFEIDEVSQLFDSSQTSQYGIPFDPVDSLGGGQPDSPFSPACSANNGDFDCRFTALSTPPAGPLPGTIPRPTVTPFVSGGVGFGLAENQDLFQMNNTLKSPYAIMASFGVQRELPGNLIVDINYFGRFGRRLVAVGDPGQQINFRDATVGGPMPPGQLLNTAFGNVQAALQSGAAVQDQPWFENQIGSALGTTCQNVFGVSCTQFLADVIPGTFEIGDVSTLDVELANAGLIFPNTGLMSQTGSVASVGNFASSSYNGVVLSVRKKLSNSLQFDFDYQYAHSIDNVSDITNDVIFAQYNGQGLICSLLDHRLCRSSADFDATHTISANYVWELPFGHGKRFLSSSSKGVDALVGGWETSGIFSFHSGFPWTTTTDAFPINFTQEAPAVFVGPRSAVAEKIHVDPDTGLVQLFADPNAASNAFGFPFGGGTGQRNQLRGPFFVNMDMAILKNFTMPWSESQHLQFRAEAFNLFNHTNFNNPSVNLGDVGSLDFTNNNVQNVGAYGALTSTANASRQFQLALVYSF